MIFVEKSADQSINRHTLMRRRFEILVKAAFEGPCSHLLETTSPSNEADNFLSTPTIAEHPSYHWHYLTSFSHRNAEEFA